MLAVDAAAAAAAALAIEARKSDSARRQLLPAVVVPKTARLGRPPKRAPEQVQPGASAGDEAFAGGLVSSEGDTGRGTAVCSSLR